MENKIRFCISISEQIFKEIEALRTEQINGKKITKERSCTIEEALLYGIEQMKKRIEIKKKIESISERFNLENVNIDNINLDKIR